MSKSTMYSYDQYDQFDSVSALSEQSNMSDEAQDMPGKDDEEVEHANDILIEELERILDLPEFVFTEGTDVFNQLNSDYKNHNKGLLGAGSNYDFDNGLMESRAMEQLSNGRNEIIKRETGSTFLQSLNSLETNSVNNFDCCHLKSRSHNKDILSTEESNHSVWSGNQSDGLDPTEIILPADFISTLSSKSWLSESQVKVEADTGSPESFQKLQVEFNHQVSVGSEKALVTGDNCCSVCSMPALKHSSYGGQVCSSCRSFFRRAAQSGYHALFQCKQGKMCKVDSETRKKCQFCRFQSCLRSGMKTTWVLSDQERKRRYGKLKTNVKGIKSGSKQFVQPAPRPSVIVFSFSTEEKKSLDQICNKFQVPWLQNFLMFDSVAGFNLIKYKLNFSESQSQNSKYQTWESFKQSMALNFMKLILPRFEELSDLSSSDVGQLKNSSASGIAQFFRSCHMFNMGASIQGKAESCQTASQVVALSSNPEIMNSLDLEGLMSRLELSEGPARMADYEELYPDGWAGDEQAEIRHREAVSKIVSWPKDDENTFDYQMVILLSLILVFHADYYTLANRDRVENIQLKYIMILHRYLRSKLKRESANRKFLAAMLLIEETRQAWNISSRYRRI